jgi:hypothetical protein
MKQYHEIRRQTDERLRQPVIHDDPLKGRFQWSMWSRLPDGFGHGISYHDIYRPNSGLVAFIRGFGWKNDPESIIQGYYLQPDAITPAAVIEELKLKVEELLTARVQHFRPETMITARIQAGGNC